MQIFYIYIYFAFLLFSLSLRPSDLEKLEMKAKNTRIDFSIQFAIFGKLVQMYGCLSVWVFSFQFTSNAALVDASVPLRTPFYLSHNEQAAGVVQIARCTRPTTVSCIVICAGHKRSAYIYVYLYLTVGLLVSIGVHCSPLWPSTIEWISVIVHEAL